jgi:hypothetical protein
MRAIERNLAELQRAILNRTTLVGLEDAGVSHLFLKLAYYALFSDYVAHCIKVFETRKQAASFWYIYRTNRKPIDAFARRNKISIKALETVSEKLKHIREKTHFHIDETGALDPKAVWHEADLKGKELSRAVDSAWDILTELQQSLKLPEVTLPEYDRALVKRLAIAIEEQWPLTNKDRSRLRAIYPYSLDGKRGKQDE